MAPAWNPTRVEAPHSAGQAIKDSAPHSVTPRGNRTTRREWWGIPAYFERTLFAPHRELYGPHKPERVAAGYIGGGLLLALVGMIGAAFIHTAF